MAAYGSHRRARSAGIPSGRGAQHGVAMGGIYARESLSQALLPRPSLEPMAHQVRGDIRYGSGDSSGASQLPSSEPSGATSRGRTEGAQLRMTHPKAATDGVALEDALRESEERFRKIFEHSHDAILVLDPARDTILDANPRACELLGYPREELLSLPISAVHPAEIPRLRAFVASVHDQGHGWTDELSCLTRAGGVVPVEISASIIDVGGVTSILAMVRDISGRRRAEAEREQLLGQLENERRQLEEVLRQMPAGVIIAEASSGRLILVNEQVEQIWRHPFPPAQDLKHYYQRRSGLRLDGRPYDPEEWPLVRSVSTGEVVRDEEIAIVRGDGTPGTMCVSSGPVYGREGHIVAAVGTYHDVTERKRAEGALRMLAEAGMILASSLDYEATLQRVATLAIPRLADWCAVDIIGEDGQVRRLAVHHADPSKTDLADQLRSQYPRYRADMRATAGLPKVLQTGRSEFYPEVDEAQLAALARNPEHLRTTQQIGMRSILIVPLVARGRVLGAIACAYAESGRRYTMADLALAEELARRAALAVDNARLYREAQRAVRVRDDFLASASHELRTPLSHIKGFVSTLRQTDVEWDEETRLDFLNEIERETDRLAGMIGNLLDMSRIESGGFAPTELSPASMLVIVQRGLDRVRGLLDVRRVVVDVPEDLPPVLVDAAQMERVVANLVENAAKYSPPATQIRISAKSLKGEVELHVEDGGPGVPPEHLERIFEKFFRCEGTGSVVPGTGLGLAICRGIVLAHGGRIRAENYPGGVRLIVRLPIAPAVPGEVS